MGQLQKQLKALTLFLNKNFFKLLLGYLIFAIAFSIIAKSLVNFKSLVFLDVLIQNFIIDQRIEALNGFLKIFTDFGDTAAMAVWTLIAAFILFLKKEYFYALGISFSVFIAELSSFVIKNLIDRSRPPEFLALTSTYSPSFPSGHTIAAISFWGFLIFFLNQRVASKSLRFFLTSLFGAIIILSGITRVYLGVHWPSDVAAGYVLGIVWVVLITRHTKNQLTHAI